MMFETHSSGHLTCLPVAGKTWQENEVNLPVLTREDYYTVPPLNKENVYFKNGQYFVENLVIGRKDFGQIYFSGISNVTGLNLDHIVFINYKQVSLYPNENQKPPVGEGLNRRAQVALDRVWPVDKETDKHVCDPQLLKEMQFEEKLRKVNQETSTTFLKYIPQTGTWVFEVEHFSKYGLADSDDEDDEVLKDKDKVDSNKQKDPLLKVLPPPQKNIQKELQPNVTAVGKDKSLPLKKLPLIPSDDDEHMEELVDLEGEDSYHSEDHDWQMHEDDVAADFGLSAKKLFLMKSSFFADDDAKTDVDVELADLNNVQNQLYRSSATFQQEFDNSLPPKLTKSFQKFNFQFPVDEPEHEMYSVKENTFSESKLSKTVEKDSPFDDLYSYIFGLDQLRTADLAKKDGAKAPSVTQEEEDIDSEFEQVTLDYPNHILPLSKTTMGQVASKTVRDWSLFKGCSFRVGWSIGNSFVFLTTQNSTFCDLPSDIANLDQYIGGRSKNDFSPCVVQRLQLCGGASDSFNKLSDYIEPHLEIQLEHSTFVDGVVPQWKSNPGVDALPIHCSVGEAKTAMIGSMEEYHNQVWNLCMALWGDLPDIADDKSGHNVLMVRKEALSSWLQNTVEKVVAEEVEKKVSASNKISDVSASIVWSLLTGKQIMEACKLSEETGDTFLTLLMAQLGTPDFVKHLLGEQIYLWNDTDANNYLEKNRLKIFLMLAGIPLFNSKSETINICEGLDWKRAFGIHLWYMISKAGSIKDANTQYNNAFLCSNVKDVYAKRPVPDYLDDDDYCFDSENKYPTYDMCYHLLQLYCNRHYRMEQIFDPATYTTDPLDYQISWFVYEVLSAIGYTHTSEYVEAQIHTFFATQLESCGMWHWAIFVLLHLKNPSRRKAAVMNTLEHYLQINGDDDYKQKEEFLRNKLRIPVEWIFEVKATRAMSERCYKTAVWYLNKTKEWSLAHSTLMQHLAANYLINENYDILYALLKPMVDSGAYKLIPDWQNKGQIIWDYLEIVDKIGKLLTQTEKVDGYLLQDLQPDLINLCQRINLLAEATPSLRLCKYDIAKRIFDLVGSVVELQKDDQMSCRILLYVSTKLPLPDDFACKERDYLLQNWASQ